MGSRPATYEVAKVPGEPLRKFLRAVMLTRGTDQKGIAVAVGVSEEAVGRVMKDGDVALNTADRILTGLGWHFSAVYSRAEYEPEPEYAGPARGIHAARRYKGRLIETSAR